MHKLMLLTFVALALLQSCPTSDAFIVKTVSVQKGAYLPSPDAAIASFTASKNALIQTVTNAVTEKINTIKSLVGSIVQSKIDAKQRLFGTVASASGGIVKSFSGVVAQKPIPVFTKTITLGYKPLFVTTSTQSVPTTTTTGAVVTTTGGGYARYVRRHY